MVQSKSAYDVRGADRAGALENGRLGVRHAYRGHCLGLAVLTATLVLASALPSWAQQPTNRLKLASKFTENFTTSPKVSGEMLVGLHLGDTAGAYDAAALQVALPTMPADTRAACVRVITRDARYWAANVYDVSGARPGFVQVDNPTSFRDRLAGYPAVDVAVRATLGDCDVSGQELFMPVLVRGSPSPNRLTLALNTGTRRTSVKLTRNGQDLPLASVCEPPPTGSKVAFTMVCGLELPAGMQAGQYGLVVSTVGLTGVQGPPFLTSVWLPDRP